LRDDHDGRPQRTCYAPRGCDAADAADCTAPGASRGRRPDGTARAKVLLVGLRQHFAR
jgi:hypothetical protein